MTLIKQIFISSRFYKSLSISILLLLFSNSISYALGFLLFLCFSFLFNDIIDFRSGKDYKCHPNRPLPSGKLKLNTAIIVTMLILSFEVILALYFGHESILLITVGSIIYSYILKNYVPLFATMLWVLLVVFGFLYINNPDPVLYVVAFLIFYSREIILDLRDVNTDLSFCKTKSLPAIVKNKTYYLSFLLIFFSSIVLLINNKAELSLVVLGGLLFTMLMYIFSTNKLKITSISMLVFVPMVLLV